MSDRIHHEETPKELVLPAVENFSTIRAIASSCIEFAEVEPGSSGAVELVVRPDGLAADEMLANVLDQEVDDVLREARREAWWESDEPRSNPYKEYGRPREEFIFTEESTGDAIIVHNFRPKDLEPKEVEDIGHVLENAYQILGSGTTKLISNIAVMPNDGRDFAATTHAKPRIDINQVHHDVLRNEEIVSSADELGLTPDEAADYRDFVRVVPGWSRTAILLAHELGHRAYDRLHEVGAGQFDVFLANTGPNAYPNAYAAENPFEHESVQGAPAAEANKIRLYAAEGSDGRVKLLEEELTEQTMTTPEMINAAESAIEGACDNFMLLLLNPDAGDDVRTDATRTMVRGLVEAENALVSRDADTGLKQYSDGLDAFKMQRLTGFEVSRPYIVLRSKLVKFAIVTSQD